MLNKSKLAQLDQEYTKKSEVVKQVRGQIDRVKSRMGQVHHKLAIMSGKGGVGKSLVTVNLAAALAQRGEKIGILDADINGPCIPTMLGVERRPHEITPDGAVPAIGFHGIKGASIDLLLPNTRAPIQWKAPEGAWDAVWKGTMEMSVVREFVGDVAWGELDLLFIDLPPGTGDKPAVITQWIPDLDGVVVVSTPSQIAKVVVQKSVRFARERRMPVIGLIENMAGFCCPACGTETELFGEEGPSAQEELGLPVLGRIPFDRRLDLCANEGRSFLVRHPDTPAAERFRETAERLWEALAWKERILAAW